MLDIQFTILIFISKCNRSKHSFSFQIKPDSSVVESTTCSDLSDYVSHSEKSFSLLIIILKCHYRAIQDFWLKQRVLKSFSTDRKLCKKKKALKFWICLLLWWDNFLCFIKLWWKNKVYNTKIGMAIYFHTKVF